jgi:hypothetical protein
MRTNLRFVVVRGDRECFCSEEELRALARGGLIQRGDLIYHPILARWLYAREVEEIRGEVEGALVLGKPQMLEPLDAANTDAVAGFILGMLGYLPVLGLICCLAGIYFSERGLRKSGELGRRGQALAVAGMVLSLAFLVPAAACDALFLAALTPLF